MEVLLMSLIRLFRPTETDFTHNEWVLNEVISCKPVEAINDDYITELEYPLEDSKSLSSNLVVGGIVSIPTLDSRPDQLFRIIDKDTSLTTVTVQMQAKLLADLKENRVRAMTLTGLTRKQAIQAILNAALDPHNYTVGNLDTNTNTNVILNVQEGSVLNALIGAENSVLSEYGGEFIINNNQIDIVDSRGSDNGVVIEYGKNLSSISEKISNTDLATVLIPKSGDYRLPEYSIESPLVGAYEKRYFKEVDLNLDIWDGTNTKQDKQVTIEEAYALMRQACSKMFTVDKVDQLVFNYTVDFVQLSQTEEYKNYAILETVNLGDTVTVRHKVLNLDLQGRVNKIAYRVDSEGNKTIDTVEIGFSRKEITDIIKDTVKQIKFAKDEISLEVKNTDRKLSARLDIQEEKIDAVVEQDGTGFGWELSKSAFKVACVGASNAYVIIDANGLEVHDGKFRLYKDSNLVFYVNTNGRCTADGGFVVDDGDATYKLDRNGLTMTNENGYTSKIYVADDRTTLIADDDFEVTNTLNVVDTARFRAYSRFYANVDIDGDLDVSGSISMNGQSLHSYIRDIVSDMTSSS
jgi:phage minor structural protein